MSPPFIPLEARLVRHLGAQTSTGCIEWTGATNTKGYGRLRIKGRSGDAMAHRVAYEISKGPIPDGLQIDHLCRNRRCCNPQHLEAVTREDNIRRGNAPHMVNARKTHCIRGHEFTPENTHWYSRPLPRRWARACIACRRAYVRARVCEAA